MKTVSSRRSRRIAAFLVKAAARALPPRTRTRYRHEWVAELDAYESEGIGLIAPAVRILRTVPATRRVLRSADRSIAERIRNTVGLPARNRNFTGREDALARLRREFVGAADAGAGAGPARVHVLQGMGGLGKTHLAIEYVHRYRHEYDLVAWIGCDTRRGVLKDLAGLADRVGVRPPSDDSDLEACAVAVVAALSRGEPFSRWLLIYDWAHDPDVIQGLLPKNTGHILITTRNHRLATSMSSTAVDTFTRQESRDFLTRRMASRVSPQEADLMADLLDDIPLALEQAAALLTETGLSVDEFAELMRAAIAAGSATDELPAPFYAAWRIALTLLGRDHPEALELLRICTFLAPARIPLRLLRGTSRARSPMNDQMIAAIRGFALAVTADRSMQIHRFVAFVIRSSMSESDHVVYRHKARRMLCAAASGNLAGRWNRKFYLALTAHATELEIEKSTDPEARRLVCDIVRHLIKDGSLGAAQEFGQRALENWNTASDSPTADIRRMEKLLGRGSGG
jgi:hypothetical protein